MKRVLKSKLVLSGLMLIVVMLGIVFAGDVIVKQGDMDVSGDMTVNGGLEVDGYISSSGNYVIVNDTLHSLGGVLADCYSIILEGLTVGDDLYVEGEVDADDYTEHSSFYDKELHGPALYYLADSSALITVNDQGIKEYNHPADPEFIQRWVEVKDYNNFTEEEVWNENLGRTIIQRIYETHEELHSSMSMKVAWLRQCVYELKQENDILKTELAQIKAKLGMQ
jgi:hypothetical protein